MTDIVNLIRQAAQPRGSLFVHDLALDAADEIAKLRSASGKMSGWSPPCPWCDGKDHWSGRIDGCPSRAARMAAAAINAVIDPGESWQAYALRIRKQLTDEAERVA